jgi:D-psicose/D-tagatose/L-ribulose 3-epimerase
VNALRAVPNRGAVLAAVHFPLFVRIGLNTFLYTSPFTTRSTGLFTTFARWGFDLVEIAIEDPAHIDAAKVKTAADRAGLALGVCACTGPGRDLRGAIAEQRATLVYARALIDQAVALGARTVIGPLYSVVGKADAVPTAQRRREWALVVRHLKTLARYAEDRGVTLCLEPLNRFETDFLNTCDQGLTLLDAIDSPAVTLLLDTFHMNIEEKNLPAAIRRAGKRLGHFHACGSDRGTPGGDHTDWEGIARALKRIDYRGDVVIESFTPDVKVIARAAAIWRDIEPRRDDIAVNGLKFLRKALR